MKKFVLNLRQFLQIDKRLATAMRASRAHVAIVSAAHKFAIRLPAKIFRIFRAPMAKIFLDTIVDAYKQATQRAAAFDATLALTNSRQNATSRRTSIVDADDALRQCGARVLKYTTAEMSTSERQFAHLNNFDCASLLSPRECAIVAATVRARLIFIEALKLTLRHVKFATLQL